MTMTPKRPPAFATWLYKHFGCGSNVDAVIGDLAEQYSRKSGLWYWRQVLTGIPVGVVTSALEHKAVAVGAIVTGCIAWFIFLTVFSTVVNGFASGPGPSFDLYNALLQMPPFMGVWAAMWSPAVSWVFYPSDSTMFRLWFQVVLPLAGWIACGWIVTRMDFGRPHRDLAPLFAGFVLLLNLVFVVPGLTGFAAELRAAGPGSPLSQITAIDLMISTVANAVISVCGILLGGSLRRNRGPAMTAVATRS